MLQLKIELHVNEKWEKDISEYFKGKETQMALNIKTCLTSLTLK